MKIPIYNLHKTEIGKKELPAFFKEICRPDLVKRAVLAMRANSRQPYGTDQMAGKKQGAKLSRRRRDYKTSYGHGISRAPRKILSRHGIRFYWVGAFSAGSVGGKAAHPPKAEKNWKQKLNKKEKKKAIQSALAATMIKELVAKHHIVPQHYPFIVETKFEELAKTNELYDALERLGFVEELVRASRKRIRASKGKFRGRRYKKPRGLLLVVSNACKVQKAAQNLPGIDVAVVNNLNAEILAPSCKPGRAALFTEAAVEKMNKERLFV